MTSRQIVARMWELFLEQERHPIPLDEYHYRMAALKVLAERWSEQNWGDPNTGGLVEARLE